MDRGQENKIATRWARNSFRNLDLEFGFYIKYSGLVLDLIMYLISIFPWTEMIIFMIDESVVLIRNPFLTVKVVLQV